MSALFYHSLKTSALLIVTSVLFFSQAAGKIPERPLKVLELNPSFETKNVFGEDERLGTGYHHFAERRVVRVQNNLGGYCTGALVGESLVLTNAHCVDENIVKKETTQGMKEPYRLKEELNVYTEYRQGKYKNKAKSEWIVFGTLSARENRADDWAVIGLNKPLGRWQSAFGWYRRLPDRDRLGIVSLAAFSGDLWNGQRLSVHEDCRIRDRLEGTPYVYHDCDSTRGASGASLFSCSGSGCHIVALHAAEFRNGHDESLEVSAYADEYANLALKPQNFSYELWQLRKGNTENFEKIAY